MKRNKLKRVFLNIVQLFRIDEWFDDVFLWFQVVIILTLLQYKGDIIAPAILFMIYHFLMLSLGHYFNSYSDLEQDIVANKKNILVEMSKIKQKILLVVLIILGALFPLFLRSSIYFYIVAYLNLFLIVFYSLRPIRFKERGVLGIVTSSLAQGGLAYLLFAIFSNIPFKVYGAFLMWILLIEASDDLTHQIDDYLNDKKSGVKTFLTEIKLKKGITINYIILSLSVIIPILYIFQDFYRGVLFFIVLGVLTGEKLDNFIDIKNGIILKIKKRA